MGWKEWGPIVEQILADLRQQQSESGEINVLKMWRARLGHEPIDLKPYQIDKIVREARRRLGRPPPIPSRPPSVRPGSGGDVRGHD